MARAMQILWRWPPENSWGEAVHIVCRELNRLQQLSDPLDPLGPRFSDSMDLHGLVKCLQNRLRRIQ